MLKQLPQNRLTLILIVAVVIILGSGFWAFNKWMVKPQQVADIPEVDLTFDPEGPYALLFPRRDGNALTLNIKRTASYDQIKYELSYNSEGVDRGAQGELNTKEKKGEYEQEILFGSCSTGGKCVYDPGVENGTLILHIRKGNQAFKMTTQWHLQKPEIALGSLVSGDGHFLYKIDETSSELPLIKYTIINELTGAPKLPNEKQVIGKVYSVNAPIAKTLIGGKVTIELADNPADGSKIARFDEGNSKWVEYDTKIDGSKLTASPDQGGIFAVLAPKK